MLTKPNYLKIVFIILVTNFSKFFCGRKKRNEEKMWEKKKKWVFSHGSIFRSQLKMSNHEEEIKICTYHDFNLGPNIWGMVIFACLN